MDGINVFNQFLARHKPQLQASGVPQHFWQAIYTKITTETFDAGAVLQMMLIEYDQDDEEFANMTDDEKECRPVFALSVAAENGIRANDPNSIFLVDHAWTFRTNMARQQLEEYEHLLNRMCAITGIDLEDDQRVNKVLDKMWKYCQAYTLSSDQLSDEDRQPIWYVMDEVGSAVGHSDEPNFRLVPFLHLDTQITYSLLFPIRDCEQGDQVCRDYVEYVSKGAEERKVLLLPWRFTDLTGESFVQSEPSAEYFSSGHIPETYPTEDLLCEPQIDRNDPLKVYAEYDIVRQHLTSPYFVLVDEPEEADVLWLTTHFKNFAELAQDTPNKYINQFPFEYVITIKDLLSITCRRGAIEHHNSETLETYPSWLPTTFNLKTELIQFASYYQNRAAKGLDNHWIVKPWNLARGLDTHISKNLTQIVRLPATGPKIAQKYIENPVLFYRETLSAKVKFDVRYVILLKNAKPLEAYIHRKFYLRFSNKPFSLDHFDDYEKHFTVMNYQDNAELHHVKCDDFLDMWQQQYPKHLWSDIEDSICSMLYELLECATQNIAAPCGIQACSQSRALYAADIMLSWEKSAPTIIQPKLLEVNWTPDCKRACDYYPDFYNDIFKLLFLNEANDEVFRLLQKHNN
ncbi:tubulin--tyrosine ligase-like protein 12 [Stomoxys calcitrans]|uniref:tubulin--tyrosine ligase-like protein 12 n=1 Tax=Stomoxys calcitrans TaxID=35570 RepID=UPI0027E39C29|nr:tubulin--tyrosine ligase-like protein 12 [Stomoxys calcitrans]